MMNFGSHTIGADDEYEKLVIRMNPPRVTVDNNSSKKATLVKVDSANKHGSLLEVVQVLIDLNLTIKRAYISSDGKWFMDVFHVVDQEGNKLYDCEVIERIQQSLGPRACSFRSVRNSIDTQSGSKQYTSIELVGRDRPGLLSEISAVLTNLKCNIVAAEVWTHNSRMASVIYITDELTGGQIEESNQLAKIKHLLCYVLKGDREKQSAKTNNSVGVAHTERRLHQMMYDDQNFNRDGWVFEEEESGEKIKLVITLENCTERGYTVVYLRCKDRPKLLFDTVFTLTDMLYVVFHATIISEGPEAYQEYYIRHQNGFPISSEVEKQRLIHCLEAAIRRRSTEGIRLELCSKDRVGLLSDVTRIFRENGLSVIRAEVSTKGSRASNVFYVTDASGCRVQSQTIEAVRNQIGKIVLCIKDDTYLKAPTDESGRFSLSNLFRSQSERFLHNLGFMRSCS